MPTPRTRMRKKAPVKIKKKIVKAKPATVVPAAKPAGRWVYHFERARLVAGSLVLTLAGLWTTNAVLAAQWAEPTQNPPEGNPPGFVWLQAEPIIPQIGDLSILGEAMFGGATLDLGINDGGQNVIYGSAEYSSMNEDDALILVQTADDTGTQTDRLRVTKDGDVTASGSISGAQLCIGPACQTSIGVVLQETTPGAPQAGNFNVNGTGVIGGNLRVDGCIGPVFRGKSATTSNGNVGGYVAANARCPSGQHVCTTAEVLNSVNCGAFDDPTGVRDDDGLWTSNLAPSHPTPTNDCVGWTTANGEWKAIMWSYHRATGGAGYAESCNQVHPFACCG